ncbi:unnamed protein product [Pipistrellus nathusii]|uniref:K Homology domain-containing protein n=1 Tax=Pipistrellus nathusii TaxID=59473 RepID=A0ABN9ZTE3_PIPNA
MDTGVIEGGLNASLTIWLLMHGKEVGSIIGKKGESVKRCASRVVHISTSQKGIVLRELSFWLDTLMPSSKPLLWKRTSAAL